MELWLGVLACAANTSIMMFNKGFAEARALSSPDPEAFGPMSQMLILLWGAAYLAVDYDKNAWAKGSRRNWVWLVFAVEKLVYVMRWVDFHQHHETWIMDTVTGLERLTTMEQLISVEVFYTVYGVVDAVFGYLFLMRWFMWLLWG